MASGTTLALREKKHDATTRMESALHRLHRFAPAAAPPRGSKLEAAQHRCREAKKVVEVAEMAEAEAEVAEVEAEDDTEDSEARQADGFGFGKFFWCILLVFAFWKTLEFFQEAKTGKDKKDCFMCHPAKFQIATSPPAKVRTFNPMIIWMLRALVHYL